MGELWREGRSEMESGLGSGARFWDNSRPRNLLALEKSSIGDPLFFTDGRYAWLWVNTYCG